MDVRLPAEVQAEVEDLVRLGEFPDAATAVVELVRQGLGYRYRRWPSPAMPPPPVQPRVPAPAPPGDVNWVR